MHNTMLFGLQLSSSCPLDLKCTYSRYRCI